MLHPLLPLLIALVTLVPAPQAQDESRATLLPGYFRGTLSLPGQTLELAVHLERDPDGSWTGSLDIPLQSAEALALPILALNGSLDLQVDAAQNLGALEAAAAEAGNPDVTAVELPGLNHIFQTSTTGQLDEYARLEETFAPQALERIATWLRERTGLD